jgi:serine/threonine protein kinase
MTTINENDPFARDDEATSRLAGSGFIGRVIANDYQIEELIGEGSMGVVFRARQKSVDREVAIKFLRRDLVRDELVARRFENEAKLISKLRHPNTITLYAFHRTPEGELLLVTELLRGKPLSKLLRAEKQLPIDRAIAIAIQVARSLAEAHAADIVHRDIKPSNIFLDRVGNEDVVKVLDFGLARAAQSGTTYQTRVGTVLGTPRYMAPEQARGIRADQRADIYALGILIFRMITGRAPFTAPSTDDLLKKHIHEPPPRVSEKSPGLEIPPELDALVDSMLAKSPADRPQSAEEVANKLGQIIALDMLKEETAIEPAMVKAPGLVVDPSSLVKDLQVLDRSGPTISPVLKDTTVDSNPIRGRDPFARMVLMLGAGALAISGVSFWFGMHTADHTFPAKAAEVNEPTDPGKAARDRALQQALLAGNTADAIKILVACVSERNDLDCRRDLTTLLAANGATDHTIDNEGHPDDHTMNPGATPGAPKAATPASAAPAPPSAPATKAPVRSREAAAKEAAEKGRVALLKGDITNGVRQLQACVDLGPIPECYRSLGVAYGQRNDKRRAVFFYKKYLSLRPNAADADRVKQAIAHTEAGR